MPRYTAPLLAHRMLGPAVSAALQHVHWFRRTGDELAGNGSLYLCRCGVVRQGF